MPTFDNKKPELIQNAVEIAVKKYHDTLGKRGCCCGTGYRCTLHGKEFD